MSVEIVKDAIPVWQPATLDELHLKTAHRSDYIYNHIRETEGRLSDAESAKVCGLTFQVLTRDNAEHEYEKLYGPVKLNA
jgi:hypothetical protein